MVLKQSKRIITGDLREQKCIMDVKQTNENKNAIFKNTTQLCSSFKINWIFWLTMIGCVLVIAKYGQKGDCNNIGCNSYISAFYTIIFAIVSGWYVHYLSHAYNLEKLYDDSTNFLARVLKCNKHIDYFIRTVIRYTFDFHDKYHHDSKINKEPFYIVWEFLVNLVLEGGWLILLVNLFSLKLDVGFTILALNKSILWLWGLLYASAHNINYIILDSEQHEKHHLYATTNYGIDTMDILMNTKYDVNNIENYNHAAINLIVITMLILWLKL